MQDKTQENSTKRNSSVHNKIPYVLSNLMPTKLRTGKVWIKKHDNGKTLSFTRIQVTDNNEKGICRKSWSSVM